MANYPVVIYGASGYTGMLVMDWLIDQNIPFKAVGRDAARIKKMMEERVVRLESARYEIVEVEHEVDALAKAFEGAKVVCNTVGPFSKFGLSVVEAALKAGCHYIDTTGEQSFVREVRDQFGELYRQAGLVVSPSNAYMFTPVEIAAELALETPGVDVLETATIARGPRTGESGVTVASTNTIFEMFRLPGYYLWDNELIPYSTTDSFDICTPDYMQTVLGLPWNGTTLPIYYQHDTRVRTCQSAVAFYDTDVMKTVYALGQQWDAEYKDLPVEEQDAMLKGMAESTTPSMPPRERTTLQRSTDFAIGRGQLTSVRATVHGVAPYMSTGALQTAAVVKLIENDFAKPGFTSACKAFGHRYLLSFLEQRGLARAKVIVL
jgi:short subunit dehydrogenase-like uncharacterized protein